MDYERLWNTLLLKLYELDHSGNIIQHTYASFGIDMMKELEQDTKNVASSVSVKDTQ